MKKTSGEWPAYDAKRLIEIESEIRWREIALNRMENEVSNAKNVLGVLKTNHLVVRNRLIADAASARIQCGSRLAKDRRTEENLRRIKSLTREQMLILSRFAPTGHPYIREGSPEYVCFRERMAGFHPLDSDDSKRMQPMRPVV